MLLARNSNQTPSLFDRFFDGEMFDWSNRMSEYGWFVLRFLFG
ncbi:MAG: hypothetical protein Q7U47_15235 [Paludibacter sp.]|nr:hypothetical protein [Paludibacter sp.]